MQPEMEAELVPYPLPSAASQQFETALRDALRGSIQSMQELRECVKPCVAYLRESGVGPVQMILTIKASARESALRNHALANQFAVANANLLLEQVVKWAILEYYRNA
jgi:hypothetical protein